jgi:NAD(P)-dependent dehydrogenase (short-subunit alcohol dehydrogenase family)
MLRERRGRIIMVASRAGTAAIPEASGYVVAKTAIMRLAENIAVETRGKGIAAFSPHPGNILSGINAGQIRKGLVSADLFQDSAAAAARMIGELSDGTTTSCPAPIWTSATTLPRSPSGEPPESAPIRVLRVGDLPERFQSRPIYH